MKNDHFVWDGPLEDAYVRIYEALKGAVSLKNLDAEKQIFIATDASKFGIGGMVYQVYEEQKQIIALFSRRLKTHEILYSIPKKELLAIVFVVKKFEKFLLGRKFTIFTDNLSLLSSIKQYSTMAWYDYLSQFSFEIEHISGADNVN